MKNYLYILTHSSSNLTLEYNPLNWNNFNILFKRSERYHSVLRSQIIDSEFPLDGKAYIDNIYDTYGIDTDIGCEIQYLDKQTQAYVSLFTGIIDLSEWSSLRDTTSVKIIDSSVMSKFIARDEVEIPISRLTDLDGDVISVYQYLNQMTVEGVNIEEKAEFDDSSNDITINASESVPFQDYHGVSDSDYDFNTIGTDADLPDVNLGGAAGPIYTNNTGSSIDVRYRVRTRAVGSVGGTGAWEANAYVGPTGSVVQVINETGAGFDTSFDSGYVTVTLANTESIHFYHEWSGVPTTSIDPSFDFEPILVEVFEVIAAEPETDVDMPLMHELGARMLEIMTGVSDPLDAPLFGRTDSEPRTYGSDGDYSLNGAASGFMLRGFRHTQHPFQTTFADFFKSIDALFNLGLWYDGTEFTILDKADFYKVSNIITLGEVKELEVSVSSEHYFNKILMGYQKEVEYDESNGQQVPNVPGEFANDGQRIQNTLDVQSTYRGDDYGIELARQMPFRTTNSEDTKFDNDNFFLTGQRDAGDYRTLQGYDNFIVITGVYSPGTRLNLDITPKRNLLRQINRLPIPLFKSSGDTLFMKTQFNLDLATQKSGDPVINELDDIPFADLDEPLFYPEVYNFTAVLTNAMILQLFSDPHGYVEFDSLGVTYSGYILEVSTEPFNRRGNWTLIKRNPNR